MKVKLRLFWMFIMMCPLLVYAGGISGTISAEGRPVAYATIVLKGTSYGATTDTLGQYHIANVPAGSYALHVSAIGYTKHEQQLNIKGNSTKLDIELKGDGNEMNEVVVTGTMKEVSRMDSPIPVEVITPKFFQKNPTPSLFEAVGMVNGVQPQLNCNVCNTGDIHINGMEGPYTMVLIDGMPIVSSLSTVYGLSGIPNSIVERIEVVKGPASSLYGSEAMGGIINVITKNPLRAPVVSADVMATSWQEYNVDASVKFRLKKLQSLLGANYFNYQKPYDNNGDGFTDMTLQNRISLFNKWALERKENRLASLAARYVYEDRWGGEMNWSNQWRGSDSIYGESIYTSRWELIGMYQLPVKEKIMTQFSYNSHSQNSYYGTTPYMAEQRVAFAQMYWDKEFGKNHSFLLGGSFRHTWYDDNTPGTAGADSMMRPVNKPMNSPLPGAFVQDEWTMGRHHKLLMGYRYDHDKIHGNIHSPRLAYKWSPDVNNVMRASFGTGFRVVNLFTEDHAALTGSREVVIAEELQPERSYNANLNYVRKIPGDGFYVGLDVTGFYSYFTNKIIADFSTNPNEIIYDNLDGYAISQGVSLNTDVTLSIPLKIMAGVTYMDVYQMEHGQKSVQLHAPKWSGNVVLTYNFMKGYTIDVTGKWNGPMRLPILPNDYRPEYSPWYCIANIQLTKKFRNGLELYGGVKNVLNFIPADPIMRPFDPFDKNVNDPVNNPYGYTFDPSYNYASMQGVRGFFGIRYSLL